MFVDGTINKVPTKIVLDTGTGITLIGGQFFDQYLRNDVTLQSCPTQVSAANSQSMTVRGQGEVDVQLGAFHDRVTFIIVEEIGKEIIIGNDYMKKWKVNIDFAVENVRIGNIIIPALIRKKERTNEFVTLIKGVTLKPHQYMWVEVKVPARCQESIRLIYTPLEIKLRRKVRIEEGIIGQGPTTSILLVNEAPHTISLFAGTKVGMLDRDEETVRWIQTYDKEIGKVRRVETETQKLEKEKERNKGEQLESIDSMIFETPIPTEDYSSLLQQIEEMDLAKDSDLTKEEQQRLKEFLKNNVDIFAKNPKNPGQIPGIQHAINTGDHPPIKLRPQRISPIEEEIIRKEVQVMKDASIIRTSKSPWAFPVVLVPKPDGSIRFCIDYRKLNAITKKDVYPLPRIDDTLDKLAGKRIFSTMDLASGYWQIGLKEEDKEKTAFISCAGLFEFNVMPFGLCNAPATFQRLMDSVLDEVGLKVGRDYIDDIIVGSDNMEEHLTELNQLFQSLRKTKLRMKLSKCMFAKRSVKFLGHVVSKDGVKPNPDKIEAIVKMKPPIDITGLRRFLGLTSYYRKFVRNYSKIAEPLNRLLQKGSLYRWNEQCQKAFEELKERLTSAPILAYPDFKKEFRLETDASDFGIGAVLAQKDEEGKERVIAYASRTLSKPERNYTTTEKECLAVVWAIGLFRPYLYGRKFVAITDHASLKWLCNMKEPGGKLARWGIKLQHHDMEIQDRPGKSNQNADALSRMDDNNVIRSIEELEEPGEQEKRWLRWIKSLEKVAVEDREENQTEGSFKKDIQLVRAIETDDYTYNQMRKCQRDDKDLAPIICFLETGSLLNDMDGERYNRFVDEVSQHQLVNELLYREVETHRGAKKNQKVLRLVVPKPLRAVVLRECHNHLFGGHLGVKRTYAKLEERYYWKGMYQDVKNWIAVCDDCTMRKAVPDAKAGLMLSVPCYEPFDVVGADFLGPLPTTDNGNTYILTFTDHFTKWVEAFALSSSDAETVAKCFVEGIVCRHGKPKKLLTDRGKAFIGKMMEEIKRLLEVKSLHTSAYHPQTNGLTERFNKTLMEMLSMYTSDHQKDWDVFLPYVIQAYRTSVHPTTGETPFFLMHGRNANLPSILDRLYLDDKEEGDTESYKQRLVANLKETWKEVKYLGDKIRQEREAGSMLTRHEHDYKTGDLVWLYTLHKTKGLSKKLQTRWHGPYRITAMTSPVNAQLQTLNNRAIKQIVHVSRLKKYVKDLPIPEEDVDILDNFDWDEEFKLNDKMEDEAVEQPQRSEEENRKEDMEEVMSEEGDIYTVKEILGIRRVGNQNQYLIRWEGFSSKYDTWEPKENLQCLEMLKEFHEKKKTLCKQCGFMSISEPGLRTHIKKNHS